MLLIAHIIVALSGIAASTAAFWAPSRLKLRISYGLVSLTLLSGAWLVVSTHTPILSGCLSGLAYVGIVLVGLIPANIKLSRQAERS